MVKIGILLILFGFLHMGRSRSYFRAALTDTVWAKLLLTSESYDRYARGFGILYMLIGVGLIVSSLFS